MNETDISNRMKHTFALRKLVIFSESPHILATFRQGFYQDSGVISFLLNFIWIISILFFLGVGFGCVVGIIIIFCKLRGGRIDANSFFFIG